MKVMPEEEVPDISPAIRASVLTVVVSLVVAAAPVVSFVDVPVPLAVVVVSLPAGAMVSVPVPVVLPVFSVVVVFAVVVVLSLVVASVPEVAPDEVVPEVTDAPGTPPAPIWKSAEPVSASSHGVPPDVMPS
jgi:hypothetical protein